MKTGHSIFIPLVTHTEVNMNGLGVHLIPIHRRHEDFDFIRENRPGIVKIINPSPLDIDTMRAIYGASLDGLKLILRNHPISEQKDSAERNPIETAQAHTRFWRRELGRLGIRQGEYENIFVEGINEPNLDAGPRPNPDTEPDRYTIWLNRTEYLGGQNNKYNATFTRANTGFGIGTIAFQFSVGWPANLKDGQVPFWGFWSESLGEVEAAGDLAYIGLHEYWPQDGPRWNEGWFAQRWKHVPSKAGVIITECGVDEYTKRADADDPEKRGWQNFMGEHKYTRQLHTYFHECAIDKRFVGFTPFTSDGAREWKSFDVMPCYRGMTIIDWTIHGQVWYTRP
jgi:hypothetical protein